MFIELPHLFFHLYGVNFPEIGVCQNSARRHIFGSRLLLLQSEELLFILVFLFLVVFVIGRVNNILPFVVRILRVTVVPLLNSAPFGTGFRVAVAGVFLTFVGIVQIRVQGFRTPNVISGIKLT